MSYSFLDLAVFFTIVFGALVLDLVAHSKDKPISVSSAAAWSAFWIALSLGFAYGVHVTHGPADAQLFLAGYFLEKSLSVDNLFIIMAIFSAFSVNDKYQHRVLYYGILGALVMRFVFIFMGTAVIEIVGKPALFGFGLFVLYSAFLMLKNLGVEKKDVTDYSNHWSVRFTKRFFPVYPRIESHDFFTCDRAFRETHHTFIAVTPLFLCLVCVEVADIMFAFDSVPAVIAITEKPFLVYTSNIFAILGLRSLYFLLSAAKRYLCHLEKAVVFILAFIGTKLILDTAGIFHIPPMESLAVVLGLLALGIVWSILFPEKEECKQ